MAKKEFKYRGKNLEELKSMSITDFITLVPSNVRRSFKRGFTDAQKKLIKEINNNKNNIKTHVRDLVIIPDMIDKTIKVYSGKEFVQVIIVPEMLGHRLGQYVLTRKKVAHSSPGVGATKSSANVSVR